MELPLSTWMTIEIWRTALVFLRIGTTFMLLPGFGEPAVPVRVRLLTALAVAFSCAQATPNMPVEVPGAWGMVFAIAAEMVAGGLIGTIARTIVAASLMAGSVIGLNIGLANVFALGLGPDQSAAIGAAIYIGLAAALFALSGHHAVLHAIVDSYAVVPAGHFLDIAAGARAVTLAGVQSFRLAGQLAMPFLLLALAFNVSLAMMNRALPALPVFMLASPAIVAAGLYLLAATAPGLIDQGTLAWDEMLKLLY
ncbi:Flagellar biosynthesis protein FliR (plasmid) [Rhodovastum atsumiense]|uniref:flagellar biosynthetic protein FliR n=1 Tax=Rhodovastum atsumiense TaxID=504468 RepID=UPI0020257911|nr:flagellar biosynthetic protein FliR [Rhodovastum atsumiense]CAH2605433.1 Flagellar biosynthesis protein FliR [Rhodovastum atsumiense]